MNRPDSNTYDAVVSEANAAGVDSDLACAIAKVESSWNPWAVRFEPKWSYFEWPEKFAKILGITLETEKQLQSCSWGLLQIMGGVARELGFQGPLQMLCGPRIGAQYACMKLKALKKRYAVLEDQISAYNAGTPRMHSDGTYENQAYVDAVIKAYAELQKAR